MLRLRSVRLTVLGLCIVLIVLVAYRLIKGPPSLYLQHDSYYDLTMELAHPRARSLMTEAFFWRVADERAPFGSDEGHGALADYREWRDKNRRGTLHEYLENLVSPYYYTYLMSPGEIEARVAKKDWDYYEDTNDTLLPLVRLYVCASQRKQRVCLLPRNRCDATAGAAVPRRRCLRESTARIGLE